MTNLRAAICRPHVVFSSLIGRRRPYRLGFPVHVPNSVVSSPSLFSPCFDPIDVTRFDSGSRFNPRRTVVRASNWDSKKSPYEMLGQWQFECSEFCGEMFLHANARKWDMHILKQNFLTQTVRMRTRHLDGGRELERDADEEKIKFAYRRLAKYYHPDVYDGRGTLEEGETAEARFIKIQAAYELLIDEEKRQQYDKDHRVNPMKASQAWMEWLMKKRKAFDQRGDMAIAAWAEQQQREMNLRVRRLSRSKIDPEEERKILAKEKKASMENFSTTLRRHTLVLKKRDLMRNKAEDEKKKVISQLLAAEGLELDTDDDEAAL